MKCQLLFSGKNISICGQLKFLTSICIKVSQYHTLLYCQSGVVGCGEGVMSLTSQGRPTDLAYSWVRLAILVTGRSRQGMYLFLLLLRFHSCSSFFPVTFSISSTISSISFLPFSGRQHNMIPNPINVLKTYLYNFDPLKPHFYIVKLGFTGVYIIFLISAQNIDCGYSLEPPHRGSSNEYPQSMF